MIVLSYVTVRPYVKQSGGVVYDSNELLHLFDGLRIIRYEDGKAETDFGPRGEVNRVVRLAAQKP